MRGFAFWFGPTGVLPHPISATLFADARATQPITNVTWSQRFYCQVELEWILDIDLDYKVSFSFKTSFIEDVEKRVNPGQSGTKTKLIVPMTVDINPGIPTPLAVIGRVLTKYRVASGLPYIEGDEVPLNFNISE